jgi:effector-binding domain-containing protein
MPEVRLEQHPGIPLAVVRRRATQQQLPQVVPEACGAVWNVVRSQNIPDAGRHVAVYLDDQINLEVGVELEATFASHGEVIASTTPSGPVATTTHIGPYQLLHRAHEAIQQWCQQNGHTPAGPNWETYGHWQQEWNNDPTKIVTHVYYLLTT